jgi:hypothetical protein
MKGTHDDAIMSMSMALYAGDLCFNQLERNTAKNVAMMESWTLSERTYEPERSLYSYGTSFDQIGAMGIDNNLIYHKDNPSNLPKDAYRQYNWLFGRSK